MTLVSRGFELSVSLVDSGAEVSTKHYNLRATNAATAATE
jgi:hypothetical protein